MFKLEYFHTGVYHGLAFEERMETGNVVFAIGRDLNRSPKFGAIFHCDAHLAKMAMHIDVNDLTALAVQHHITIELLWTWDDGTDACQLGNITGHGDKTALGKACVQLTYRMM